MERKAPAPAAIQDMLEELLAERDCRCMVTAAEEEEGEWWVNSENSSAMPSTGGGTSVDGMADTSSQFPKGEAREWCTFTRSQNPGQRPTIRPLFTTLACPKSTPGSSLTN